MKLLKPFWHHILACSIMFATAHYAWAEQSSASSTGPSQDQGANIHTIPYEALIKQAVGDLKATDPVLQPRPSPLAPVNPELIAAWKEIAPLNPGATRYAAAKQAYLDAIEKYGDPTGMLPTFPDTANDDSAPKILQAPIVVVGLLDAESLLVETREQGKLTGKAIGGIPTREIVRRLWKVTETAAKPVLAIGDEIKVDGKNADPNVAPATVSDFKVLKPSGSSGRVLLAIKVKGAQPALEKLDSYVVWDGQSGLQFLLRPNEKVPGLDESWFPVALTNSLLRDDGTIAMVIQAVRQSDARVKRRFVVIAHPGSALQLAAAVLDKSADSAVTNVQFGTQSVGVKGGRQALDLDVGAWNQDGTLRIIVQNVVGLNGRVVPSGWNYSIQNAAAEPAKDSLDAGALPRVGFELAEVEQISKSNPNWRVKVRVPVLVTKDGNKSNTVITFPIPALDGFQKDQTLDAQAPHQSTDPIAVAAPDGRIAFTAYVSGNTPVTFDPDQGKNVANGRHSKQWLLLETTVRGGAPRLVAESDMPFPAPEFTGKHYLGSISQMAYLPDGRLLFAGADDVKEVVAGMNPAASSAPVSSIWIWDGKHVTLLADRYSAVEVPAGSKRVLEQFTYELQPALHLLLLRRAADGSVFTLKVPSP